MAVLRGIGGVGAALLSVGDEHVARAEMSPPMRGEQGAGRARLLDRRAVVALVAIM
jgi:hypothetical protein